MLAEVSTLPASHALTPWGMYLAADWVVQSVMVGLALASLATWTVLIAKAWELTKARRALTRARDALQNSAGLADADATTLDQGLPRAMLDAAHAELRLSADAQGGEGIKERVASRLERIELAHARRLRAGTGVLATIGATAPFVGLFGTVWGIMNSFIGIAEANTTNLAVVAPGIAEALLATALGLVAAIPAVVIYNQFTRQLAAIRGASGDVSACVQQLVSRDLDRGRAFAAGVR